MSTWDKRDEELDLRKRLAEIVASKISGVNGAEPDEIDFTIADKLGAQIETLWNEEMNPQEMTVDQYAEHLVREHGIERKILCIKEIRGRFTYLGLIEAKEIIEAAARRLNWPA